jgi:hypothetical protein
MTGALEEPPNMPLGVEGLGGQYVAENRSGQDRTEECSNEFGVGARSQASGLSVVTDERLYTDRVPAHEILGQRAELLIGHELG